MFLEQICRIFAEEKLPQLIFIRDEHDFVKKFNLNIFNSFFKNKMKTYQNHLCRFFSVEKCNFSTFFCVHCIVRLKIKIHGFQGKFFNIK